MLHPVATAVLLAVAGGLAAADSVSGSCTKDENTWAFTDGVVYTEPDPFDDKIQQTVVMLTTIPLDKVAIARASDIDDAVREQVWGADGAARLELNLDKELNATGIHVMHGGGSASTSGTGLGQVVATTNDGKRLAGTFENDGFTSCKLSFDLSHGAPAAAAAAAPPAPKGKPLPAGGGEPGKVFLRNLAASQKGDLDGMIATASKEQAEEMRKSKGDPDLVQMLELMKAFVPKSAKVTGGRDFGDRAELDVEGVEQDGSPSTGLVTLVKEGGAWKVEKSSFKSKG